MCSWIYVKKMHIYPHSQSENAAPTLGGCREIESYKMNQFFPLLCSQNAEKQENLKVLELSPPVTDNEKYLAA